MKSRHIALLAIGAAYCFLVMMFNVPIPDGTTAHAVGGVLVAVVLGPEAAVIAVSIALGIQALFFGDGGVLAFGANCFNMALVLPMAGYAVYRLFSRGAALTAPRRAIAAGIGAYVGLNMAALCAAIEFGLQPTLFHSADGTPLYAPFHLAQTIPAMALAHLTVAGGVEARADGRRGRLPAAGQPAAPADQPPRRPRDGGPRSCRPARDRLAPGTRRASACSSCSPRSGCSRPAARSARTLPTTSTSGGTG